jgi:hypothetical protein
MRDRALRVEVNQPFAVHVERPEPEVGQELTGPRSFERVYVRLRSYRMPPVGQERRMATILRGPQINTE